MNKHPHKIKQYSYKFSDFIASSDDCASYGSPGTYSLGSTKSGSRDFEYELDEDGMVMSQVNGNGQLDIIAEDQILNEDGNEQLESVMESENERSESVGPEMTVPSSLSPSKSNTPLKSPSKSKVSTPSEGTTTPVSKKDISSQITDLGNMLSQQTIQSPETPEIDTVPSLPGSAVKGVLFRTPKSEQSIKSVQSYPGVKPPKTDKSCRSVKSVQTYSRLKGPCSAKSVKSTKSVTGLTEPPTENGAELTPIEVRDYRMARDLYDAQNEQVFRDLTNRKRKYEQLQFSNDNNGPKEQTEQTKAQSEDTTEAVPKYDDLMRRYKRIKPN